MRLLLDTHILIWALSDTQRLPAEAERLILDPMNEVFISAVTIWEVAIKHALNRKTTPPFSASEAMAASLTMGFAFADVSAEHAAAVENLPPIHADPFDRLIVAHALVEPFRLVTVDKKIAAYSDTIILV